VTRRHLESAALPAVLFAVALVIRSMQHHAALLYPDGYQYLLMARGIGEHLQPTTVLGPGGDPFVPSADAAVKPFFPLVVAGVHSLGAPWLDAARLVTVVSGAWAVTAAALLVTRLGGSRAAGLAAGALLLTSPSIGFWSGFSGPDPLAVALVLSAALAFACRHPGLGGALVGLAVATRPEIALVAFAAGVFALRGKNSRRQLARAAPAAVVVVALVYGLLRTPVSVTDWRLAWLVPVLAAGIGLMLAVPAGWLRYAAMAAAGLVVLAVAVEPGPLALWHEDWPLLVAGAAGLAVLLDRRRDNDAAALTVVAVVLLLGSVYLVKNPGLVRYFSLLLPAAALLAGLALSALSPRERVAALPAIAVVAAIGWFQPIPGNRDFDMFPMVARGIAGTLATTHPQPLVTAAPDAYGFWLPRQPVHGMRAGARGAVLLDAAQRLYEPRLTARGRAVVRVSDDIAFARPDLEIDAGPAVLVVGRVVARAAR
jgi:Dolichyl-phosphate-mannose-protein mannosyltransferase